MMMQRWCWRFRSLASLTCSSSSSIKHYHPSISNRLFHTYCPNPLHKPHLLLFTNTSLISKPNASLSPLSAMQVRHITLKQRKRKLKSRQPTTPVVSKVKKIKMKSYSSFKRRFRVMNDGQIRRWKEGKRHNAFAKSKKSKRRLRQPGLVPPAYAKVMKKLNFCA